MSCMLLSGTSVRPTLPRNVSTSCVKGTAMYGICQRRHSSQRKHCRVRAEQQRESQQRESTAFGELEGDEAEPPKVPEPSEKDFWEGENWEWLGKLSFIIVPALVLLAILVGAFAAKTYDSGATSYLAPSSPDDATVRVIPNKPESP